jgi:hypothetical protein
MEGGSHRLEREGRPPCRPTLFLFFRLAEGKMERDRAVPPLGCRCGPILIESLEGAQSPGAVESERGIVGCWTD